MVEPKFTSGPWVLDGHCLSTVLHCTAERGSPEAKHICGDYEVIARCEGDNRQANARAIAALPEMVEAFSALLPTLEALRFTVGLGKNQMARIERARAALSKAASPSKGGDAPHER
mgnify:CR=1 FL=1